MSLRYEEHKSIRTVKPQRYYSVSLQDSRIPNIFVDSYSRVSSYQSRIVIGGDTNYRSSINHKPPRNIYSGPDSKPEDYLRGRAA